MQTRKFVEGRHAAERAQGDKLRAQRKQQKKETAEDRLWAARPATPCPAGTRCTASLGARSVPKSASGHVTTFRDSQPRTGSVILHLSTTPSTASSSLKQVVPGSSTAIFAESRPLRRRTTAPFLLETVSVFGLE